jgi:hypothetical protein
MEQKSVQELNNHDEKLGKEKMVIFHTFVAEALFLAKRGGLTSCQVLHICQPR